MQKNIKGVVSHMKMKKILVLLAVGVTVLGCLSGCGKKEEKTSYEQMKEDVQNELQENEELHSKANATENELNVKWRSVLEEKYLDYENSTDPTEIVENAQIYNKVLNEMTVDVENSGFKAMNCSEINDFLTNVAKTKSEISELEYNTKALYYKAVVTQGYEKFICYYDKESSFSMFVLLNNESNWLINEMMIIKSDGSSLKMNMSDFEKNDYVNAGIYSVTEERLIFWTNYNADSYYYEVDISGDSATLITSGQGGCEDYEQKYKSVEKSVNDDELNSLIFQIRNY